MAAARGAGRLGGLLKHRLGHGGVFLKIFGQLVVDHAADQRLDIGVAQLGFGLALELGLLQLDADDGGQALLHVATGQVVVLVLQIAFERPKSLNTRGQRGLEALLVGAAVRGVDVVGKAQDQAVEAVVILQRHLGHRAVGLTLHIDDLGVQHGHVPLFVQVLHKAADAALVAHAFAAGFGIFLAGALVSQGDAHAALRKLSSRRRLSSVS